MIITQRVVAIRGDQRDITMTLPAGAALQSAQSVTFYAREDVDDVDTDALWEQAVTPSSDTVAVATIAADEWAAWEDAGSPRVLGFALRVVDGAGVPRTPVTGTITVVATAAP